MKWFAILASMALLHMQGCKSEQRQLAEEGPIPDTLLWSYHPQDSTLYLHADSDTRLIGGCKGG